MDDPDRNIVDLAQRRRDEEARRKAELAAQAKARREAEGRRKLAEHGPAPARLGRSVGRVLAAVVWLVLLGAVAAWAWKQFGAAG